MMEEREEIVPSLKVEDRLCCVRPAKKAPQWELRDRLR
jgi:hypothetical protein